MQPSNEQISALKATFPDRSLHLVEAVVKDESSSTTDEVAVFVMTGPSRDEYKKFADEVFAAKDMKGSESDRIVATRGAIERAALAQIRWPARDVVQKLFEHKPAMVDGFADELHKAAGSNVELRSKKL